MLNSLTTQSVLVLNALWQPIGTTCIQDAVTSMNSSVDGVNYAARGINVVYRQNKDGSLNLEEVETFFPLNFDEWVKLPPRPDIDTVIRSPKITLRCPTILLTNYSKMPMRKFRPTMKKLYEMQDGKCGYSGEIISHNQASLEHKIPRSHGGKDTFENLMVVKKEINHKRGNRPLADVGLTPLFFHREPKPLPVCYTIKKIGHVDWTWFL